MPALVRIHLRNTHCQLPRLRTGHRAPLALTDIAAFKSRRLDSHQHEAVYKTAAFLGRATSAKSRSAPIRTVSSGFGDRPLSQEHTPVRVSEGNRTAASTFTASHAIPLHHRHHQPVVPAGFEPAIFPMSRGCP